MKEMSDRKPKRLTVILVGIIIVLILVFLYVFVLKPSLNGYAVKLQNQGIDYTLNTILSQLQQKGYVDIPVGNQTLRLVPYQAPSG